MKIWALLGILALVVAPVQASVMVAVETTQGDFVLQLNEDKAPKTVSNFLRYVDDGSYVGTQFHRVIPRFVVQGGGFDQDLNRRPTYEPVDNESRNGLHNRRATIAMARTQDPDSATRQFYINVSDNGFLDATPNKLGYTVFGRVVEGFNTILTITEQPTVTIPSKRMQDVPQQPIIITAINRVSTP
ncbi:peptidyl-prolyl cis-trans isomerase [Salinivibrio kushneri]|uniref:peptidylprolyl isomerase n=1 Tax=Salinivibrio kushneri TaxID=1908198 RepID=UPI000989464A|nr:peptidylprolyl isomerase [Salinivibrio kushneri]OOE32400.1 peptidyl-prolyl cis-trans isomerase [Salinivibrio kushneri]OOE71129.1 peptidyl-prolyl cis-trans isomerase [Salinivibrio kushneri]